MKGERPGADPKHVAREMLLGQHSVRTTADHTGRPVATVSALATQLHAQKRIPRVRQA